MLLDLLSDHALETVIGGHQYGLIHEGEELLWLAVLESTWSILVLLLVWQAGWDLHVVELVVALPLSISGQSLVAGSAHSGTDDFADCVVGVLRKGSNTAWITRDAVKADVCRMHHVLDAAFKGLLDAILSHRGELNKTQGHPQTFGTVVHLHVLVIACLAEGRRLVGQMNILAL